MHAALRWGFLVLSAAILLPAVNAFSCSVKNGGCGSNEKCVFTLYATTDSHISECASGYNYKVCCDELPFECSVKSSCSGGEDRILPVFSSTDAHYYPLAGNSSVCCYKPAPNYLDCSVRYSSCPAGNVCLASVNSTTEESHAGDCGYSDYKVCCKVIDTTPPDIVDYSGIPLAVEKRTILNFSAAILDYSPIDRAVVCNSPVMCYGKPGQYCVMRENAPKRYNCSYDTSLLNIGNYQFYIVANDSFGNTNSLRMDSKIRTTSLAVDSVEPQLVDLQDFVTIKANYTENDSYTIAGASCGIFGDVSGTMSFDGKQYVSTAISPSKLESNSFTVTCSNYSFPTLSVLGDFIARDLSIELDFEYDPLAKEQTNFLYADVKTVSKYERVKNANKASFDINKEGVPFSASSFVWNSTTGRWEANFTPDSEGNYTASVYFNATVEGGILDGSASMRMNARKGFALSRDVVVLPIPVELGSSALVNIIIENRRGKDVVYNVTFVGDLVPVFFDGQALPANRKTFILVPAKSVQSHPLLIKGMEVSSQEKEVRLTFKENQVPYNSDSASVTYTVFYGREGRKYAPDLNVLFLLMIAGTSILFLAGRLSRRVRA